MVGKTLLGHYEILEPLGAGGMGEVYRARDTKLDRDVAIKVLPADFASDADRLARFEREAKLLASLNHANIAAIYGLEDEGDQRLIVMEVVEGETLAERISRQGRIEVDEALDIARQIAEALEAAHDNGVIHRDLKPANVKVTPDGRVKVLDFGLAKAYEADGSSSDISPDLSHSPTMAAATRTGVILGTAAYMSPEQARGKPVDKRTDIWAFGCVLFEVLGGSRAFDGETVSDTMAAILKEKPDWNALPESTPPGVMRVARRCLVKDPRERWHDIADARIELADASSGEMERLARDAAAAGGEFERSAPSGLSRVLPWALAATGFALAAVAMFVQGGEPAGAEVRPIVRTDISLPLEAPLAPPGEFFLAVPTRSLELSRNGDKLVYVALVDGQRELWIRDMRDGSTRPLSNTRGATWPFFSPDGERIGFYADNKLKVMSTAGGDIRELADAVWGHGAAWSEDGWIYFVPTEGVGISRVAVDGTGGTVEQITLPLPPTWGHIAPKLLPGGEALLLDAVNWVFTTADVIRLDDPSSVIHAVRGRANGAQYLPSGHLIYGANGNLMAAPFDLDLMRASGAAQVILDDVQIGDYDITATWSEDGTFVYAAGPETQIGTFEWVDRDGNRSPIPEIAPARLGSFTLSPDGDRLVYVVEDDAHSELWLYDIGGPAPIALTSGHIDDSPVWGPDGETVYFVRVTDGAILYRMNVNDPVQTLEQIMTAVKYASVRAVLEEGMIFERDFGDIEFAPFGSGDDLLDEDNRTIVAGSSESAEVFAALSPDERFLAYTSDETGRWEVQLVSYPEGQDKRRISTDGGEEPRWNPAGGEIIYRNGVRWYSVPFDGAAGATPPAPTKIFEGPFVNVGNYSWEIAPDGERFLVISSPGFATPVTRLMVISNFLDELERRVPTGR